LGQDRKPTERRDTTASQIKVIHMNDVQEMRAATVKLCEGDENIELSSFYPLVNSYCLEIRPARGRTNINRNTLNNLQNAGWKIDTVELFVKKPLVILLRDRP
jgi:hypothetical protein